MDSEEREADITDAGGGRDVGEGYPEEQPPGASPEGESPARSGGDEGKPDPESSDPGTATGNPDAAG
jgi:hypothetical protein